MKNLAVLALLLLPALAVTLDVYAPLSAVEGRPIEVKVRVYNDSSTPMQNPQCYGEFVYYSDQGSTTIFSGELPTSGDEAVVSFDMPQNDVFFDVYCYDGSYSGVISVIHRAWLDVNFNPPKFVGDYSEVRVYYESSQGPVDGTCDLILNRNGVTDTYSMIRERAGEFSYLIYMDDPGDYSITVKCSAAGYESVEFHQDFSVKYKPVIVNLPASRFSYEFGKTLEIKFTTDPPYASCTPSYGEVVGNILKIPVTFLGERRIELVCSAYRRETSRIYLWVEGLEAETILRARVEPYKIYSFSDIKVYPLYYTKSFERIKGADCTVSVDNMTYHVNSFTPVNFTAPPGPRTVEVYIQCGKFGYRKASSRTELKVYPLPMGFHVKLPDYAKAGERVPFLIKFTTPVNATCRVKGVLKSETGEKISVESVGKIKEEGKLWVTLPKVGKFVFTVNCSATGYENASVSGSIDVKLFSVREETAITIVLSTLTVLLAVGFVMLRRWLA